MQGVPQQFPCEKDRARFRHLPEMPGVELYHAHISSYAFEPHTHEAFGMGTIDYGAERFRYRGSNYVAPTHSLVLMNPDELHTGESATEDGWRYRMIYIEPQVLEALSGEQGWWFTDAVREDLATSQQLSRTLAALWQADDSLAVEGQMFSIMQLLRPHARVAKKRLVEPAQRFDIVRDYLRENFTRNITLAELSTLVSLSPYHFLRQFKRQHHVTPHQMLMAFRLYEAKQLLMRGIAAAEVAATVGLSDQAHLTRTFAQRYGITPIRYQKQVTG
ncbi:AraC family transcriptional regulator [Erwiniaceae bacterium BAC15a-03b]|uniref:AraC family transcriptional regulator n=1 Tax=Winslowiella arboricola TaxID=2978220 RepID=A0A9J6PST1_9GAMM|nr:AraC family transcriptional regulator [Winslowiella arboricola]MCU5772590.1 AraC family transcriptional regulator [Winslowiella arboricola]MCU5778624.1 AraC family transcriptional regulator [Winslowiella arboricola]